MAHLWMRDEEGRWAVMPLEGESYALSESPPRRMVCDDGSECQASVVLMRRAASGRETQGAWVIVAEPRARVVVNGRPVVAGLRAVSDRDEIAVAGVGLYFFSAETLAAVERFPGSERSSFCPRCKQTLVEGGAAVRCPQCRVWHHQTEELPCWTYADVCALCPQTTQLDAGFRWTPEEL